MKKLNWKLPAGNRRVLKHGSAATLISVFAVAAVVLVNCIFNALPSDKTQLDLSNGSLFTLSDDSKALVAGIEQDVKIYYLAQTGSEDSNITKILDRYAALNSRLSWTQVDPAIDPSFARKYGNGQTVSNGSVILTCGDSSRVLAQGDLYNYDYSNYMYTGTYDVSFDAENAIDIALLALTGGEAMKVYQLTGHGETELTSSLTDSIESQNLTVDSLNLLSGDIPGDAAAIVINAPTADLSEADLTVLRNYLSGGGSLLVMTAPASEGELPNLDILLAENGMTRVEGIAVEQDAGHSLQGYSHYILPEIENHGATSGVSNRYVLTPLSQGIALNTENSDLTLTALLTTTDRSYSKLAGYNSQTYDKEDGDIDGPLNLAAAAEGDGKLIWVNCAAITDRQTDALVSGGNTAFLVSCLSWMTGSETVVLAAAKSLQGESLVVNGAAGSLLGLGYVILLPLTLLVAGIAVTMIRRRK